MANLRITELLHDAKVFVLYVADEVTFKARQLMEVDQELPRGGTPVDEAFEDELPEGASDVPNVDAVEEFDDLEEEDLDLPGLRLSHEDLLKRVPRSMLMQAGGGFAEDDRIDR